MTSTLSHIHPVGRNASTVWKSLGMCRKERPLRVQSTHLCMIIATKVYLDTDLHNTLKGGNFLANIS